MLIIRFLIYGLVALSPEHELRPKSMAVYLVNASGSSQSSDGCPLHFHKAFLAFQSTAKQCPSQPPCKFHMPTGHCICDLVNHEVTFDPPLGLRERELGNRPGELPAETQIANSFAWVPRLGEVDGIAQPAAPKSYHALDDEVAAKTIVSWDGLQVCQLAELDQGVQAYRFRPASRSTPAASHRQAIAEAVMATVAVPGNAFRVKLRAYDADTPLTVTIPCASGRCADIKIGNTPPVNMVLTEEEEEGERCDPGLKDRHFELYYGLLFQPPALDRRAIPHAVAGRTTPIQAQGCPSPILPCSRVGEVQDWQFEGTLCLLQRDDQPQPEQPGPTASARPICTMVVF